MQGLLKNENIFTNVFNVANFKALCLHTFQRQYSQNVVYKNWVDALGVQPAAVQEIEAIPFLPISFFKQFEVLSAPKYHDTLRFTSSGTTGQTPSQHLVTDITLYETSFKKGFDFFYSDITEYALLALLPNYLQRGGSSLVYMCDQLIKATQCPESGFYLDNYEALLSTIEKLKSTNKKILLIGVSYGLLDLCSYKPNFGDRVLVMETGGMKGTRKEMLKPELHAALQKGLAVPKIHSEYGMTELLSQAYSLGDGLFSLPPWMHFLIRETDDPLAIKNDGRTGGINIIDLANQNSCSFIATQDLGRAHPNRQLELMGRFDDSDVRGCNLMLENY